MDIELHPTAPAKGSDVLVTKTEYIMYLVNRRYFSCIITVPVSLGEGRIIHRSRLSDNIFKITAL